MLGILKILRKYGKKSHSVSEKLNIGEMIRVYLSYIVCIVNQNYITLPVLKVHDLIKLQMNRQVERSNKQALIKAH